jgi:hypothetical protein
VNLGPILRDAIARIVAVQEALAVGDTEEAFAFLVDLEGDLVGSLAAICIEERAA